jgi:hypothetical protein
MGPATPEDSHAAAVDAWLRDAVEDAAPAVQLELFRAAIEALWNRAAVTLGSVTLLAIAGRVLSTATHRHGFLSAVHLPSHGDARWKAQLRDRLAAVPRAELITGLRFGLVELLTVIGRLTAEILSPELHAALAAVTAANLDAEAPTSLHVLPTISTGKAQS